jgi:hypothetical protein
MRHCGAMRVGSGVPLRVRFWLTLRGSPPGRRLLPVLGFTSKGFFAEIRHRRSVKTDGKFRAAAYGKSR